MASYGQYCAVARALDLLGERWTLLVVRELLFGSRRFNDIRRGLPRISKTLLADRLRALVDGGVAARSDGAHGPEYTLTDAGRALFPLVAELGQWGQRWLPRTLPGDELDADGLVWDMRRRVATDALPPQPVVVRIDFTDLRRSPPRYLLLRREEVALCVENLGFPEELRLRADRRTLIGWWRGDLSWAAARRAGLTIDGKSSLARAFPSWFARYLFAETQPMVAPRQGSVADDTP
jgi:DNA-binding HxlR family transcriptional regulator